MATVSAAAIPSGASQAPWEGHVRAIEETLDGLDHALRGHDPLAVETAAQALHKGMAEALAAFREARRQGRDPLTPPLRERLALAQMRIAALQTTVHRAGGSVQRMLGILFPSTQDDAATYTALAGRGPAAAALNAYRG